MYQKFRRIFELRGDPAAALRPMEGLRGLAVLLVFFVHYGGFCNALWTRAPGTALGGVLGLLAATGSYGVDLFFVLSGYLIYGQLMSRAQPFARYFRRRIQRIYPVFLVILAINGLLSLTLPGVIKWPTEPLAFALYLTANLLLLPGLFPIDPIVLIAWSLSYEMLFYLLTPLAIRMLDLRAREPMQRILGIALVAVSAWVVMAFFGGPIRMVLFAAGMILYELVRLELRPRDGSLTLLVLPVGFGLAMAHPAFEPDRPEIVALAVATFFILCWGCFAHAGLARSLFSWAPLRWFGNMSYSYYLTHFLALNVLVGMVASVWTPGAEQQAMVHLVFMPVLFALTLIPAAVCFVLIEKPLSLTPRREPHAMAEAPAVT